MGVRVGASVAFSVSATLVLMFVVSRFPGMEIPPAYWIFGAACPATISFTVSLLLARQTERIRELQRQRDGLVGLLSHDMRAPQASIIALLDDPTTAWSPDVAQRVRGYAARTLKLADDMVQLSRAQMPSYRLEELSLAAIVDDATDALAPQARARQVRFEQTGARQDHWVRGEPSLLARALINLLDNAVKFSPAGSVVRLDLARAVRGKRDWIVCAVSDRGPGIPSAQLAELAGRFAAGTPGAGGPRSGTGLGLAFVQTVVQRHGGTIACVSREGQGATFRIELPALD